VYGVPESQDDEAELLQTPKQPDDPAYWPKTAPAPSGPPPALRQDGAKDGEAARQEEQNRACPFGGGERRRLSDFPDQRTVAKPNKRAMDE